jgi:hypothetical protein
MQVSHFSDIIRAFSAMVYLLEPNELGLLLLFNPLCYRGLERLD